MTPHAAIVRIVDAKHKPGCCGMPRLHLAGAAVTGQKHCDHHICCGRDEEVVPNQTSMNFQLQFELMLETDIVAEVIFS